MLAKCMATENIRVEHRADAETASFNVKDRVLVLPVWKDMSEAQYDMLVGHEVSHALHTPFEEWVATLDEFDGNSANLQQVANVVEDARIERKIKEQFPGLKRDFATAYTELHNRDLFELNGKNIADLGLIDRLNLEFKLGLFGLVQVPFSADERQYVTRMAETETFAEVVVLAKELYELWKQDPANKNQQMQGGQGQSGAEGDGNGEDGENAVSTEASGSDTSESTDGAGNDAEAQQGENGEGQQDDSGAEQGGMSYDDYSDASSKSNQRMSETQDAFDKGMNDMRDESGKSYEYHTLPQEVVLENVIIDYKEINEIWDTYNSQPTNRGTEQQQRIAEQRIEQDNACIDYLNKSKSVVNHMVQEFQMKQAADEDRRTDISKTGVLDTTSMINYRWSEDIFLKNHTVRDGKNHGMIFFLDWSSSMHGIIKDTVEQLLLLTEFCQKMSIPFEVYAFSSGAIKGWITHEDGRITTEDGFTQCIETSGCEHPIKAHNFSLLNFLSSRMNRLEYTNAKKNLYRLGVGDYYSCPKEFQMGCTPLNEAIISSLQLVPEFQDANGVEIVNTVFLTDGEGQSTLRYGRGSSYGTTMIHDPKTRRDYKLNKSGSYWGGETNAYLRCLKERTGCNLIGIRLTTSKNVAGMRYYMFAENDIADAVKSYKNNNFALASQEMHGYDAYFIVKGNLDVTEDIFNNIDEGDSFRKIANAFKKGAGNSKANRVIATKMVEIFAQQD